MPKFRVTVLQKRLEKHFVENEGEFIIEALDEDDARRAAEAIVNYESKEELDDVLADSWHEIRDEYWEGETNSEEITEICQVADDAKHQITSSQVFAD